MAYNLRRYIKRNLYIQSNICWLLIAVIFISILTVAFYDSQLLAPHFEHPISIRWRREKLSLVIRPELETARIQPQLGNHQFCIGNISHKSFLVGEPIQILIMVMSAPRNLEVREAIRQTWANKTFLPSETSVFFMLGTTNDEEVTKKVEEESAKHNDIIVEDFFDSYENLTFKTLFSLKWATKWCSAATHLLKTDDDMLILVDNLKNRLRYIRNNYFLLQVTDSKNWRKIKEDAHTNIENEDAHTNIENEDELIEHIQIEDFKEKEYGDEYPIHIREHLNMQKNDIFDEGYSKREQNVRETKQIGSISGAYVLGKVYHSVAPNRDKESKWFLPWSLYPEEYLPDFASGTAYIIANGNVSYGAIKSILTKSLEVRPALPLEDVFITGIVAGEGLGLPLIEDSKRFHKAIPLVFPWSVSHLASCYHYDSIAIHGMTPKDIITGWRKLRELKAEECNTIMGFLQTSIYRFLMLFEMHINKS